jgi:hypothetical protein
MSGYVFEVAKTALMRWEVVEVEWRSWMSSSMGEQCYVRENERTMRPAENEG